MEKEKQHAELDEFSIPVKGEISFVVKRADGKVEDLGWTKNLVTISGQDWMAAYFSSSPGSAMAYMDVGTVSTAVTLADSNITGRVGSRVAIATKTSASNVLTEVCTFAGFVTGITSLVLREVGGLNATSGGTLRARTVFSSITLADSDFLQVSYRTTVGSR